MTHHPAEAAYRCQDNGSNTPEAAEFFERPDRWKAGPAVGFSEISGGRGVTESVYRGAGTPEPCVWGLNTPTIFKVPPCRTWTVNDFDKTCAMIPDIPTTGDIIAGIPSPSGAMPCHRHEQA